MIYLHLVNLVVQNVSAKASGCRVRRVRCEHCGKDYIYQLRRSVSGSAQSFFFIGKAGKAKVAEARAAAKLEKVLAAQNDPIPCPFCGHFQKSMFAGMRKRHLQVFVRMLLFGGLALAFLWILTDPFAIPTLRPAAQAATLFVVAGLMFYIVWIFLRDPDAGAHRRTREALGANCRAMPAEEFDALLAEGEEASS